MVLHAPFNQFWVEQDLGSFKLEELIRGNNKQNWAIIEQWLTVAKNVLTIMVCEFMAFATDGSSV